MAEPIIYNSSKSKELVFDVKPLVQKPFSFNRAKDLATQLGCTIDGNLCRFIFWNPDFKEIKSAVLQLYIPSRYLNFDKPEQHATFQYRRIPLHVDGEFAFSVVEGLPKGDKESFGALYEVKIELESGDEKIIRDPMAGSMPFGIYGPAEVYDTEALMSGRSDTDYFQNLSLDQHKRVQPSVNLLEIHVQTATKRGTLYSLNERYKQIAYKLDNGKILTPDEKNLTGFDAVELMPLAPVNEHPENHQFWDPINIPETDGEEITVRLSRPHVLNWGYDITIFGAAAVNPSLLSTGRPDELLELIETLHNFPTPIKVVLDVVYGHADNAALNVLPDIYFSGPNMYGQDIRIHHPLVRAIILELHRRKINFGFDGVRVDGAQDFKYFDKGKEKLLHDDDFLNELSNVKQVAAGVEYRPWMIFEDGRPWPRDDWELASTYREITENQPHAFQWAPMIFAYNTPYTYTYWVSKWWRLREMLLFGHKWIGGYANHDTMRRGTQADPAPLNINTLLGNSLKMVMENAYNNPSTTLLMHGFLPGVPMDFLHALGSTPWSFIRNTDLTYAVKVVAEEAHFLDWQITENEYRQARFFKRLKAMGFDTLEQLQRFSKGLLYVMKATENDPSIAAKLLNSSTSFAFKQDPWDKKRLNAYATAWMQDLNEYCNVDNHSDYVNRKKSDFNHEVRMFRLKNPWLINNFGENDTLSYIEPVNGTIIYYGYRKNPENGKEIVFVANMEGHPRQVVPSELIKQVDSADSWNVACSTPSITRKQIDEPVRLSISQGLLFECYNF